MAPDRRRHRQGLAVWAVPLTADLQSPLGAPPLIGRSGAGVILEFAKHHC